MNTLQMVGKVLSIQKPTGGNSAKITIQYNVRRTPRQNATRQFINACELRVPEKAIKQLEGIQPGHVVQILGRVQGVISAVPGSPSMMYCELVASRIEPWRLIEELLIDNEGSLPSNAGGGEAESD